MDTLKTKCCQISNLTRKKTPSHYTETVVRGPTLFTALAATISINGGNRIRPTIFGRSAPKGIPSHLCFPQALSRWLAFSVGHKYTCTCFGHCIFNVYRYGTRYFIVCQENSWFFYSHFFLLTNGSQQCSLITTITYSSRAAEGLAPWRCGNLLDRKVPIPAGFIPDRWYHYTPLYLRHPSMTFFYYILLFSQGDLHYEVLKKFDYHNALYNLILCYAFV